MTEQAPADAISKRTEVLHGEQNVVNTVLQFTSRAKSRINACVDYTRPSLAVEIKELSKAFLDAKRRGVRLRYVTEITDDNVIYCKELIQMVDELRHIDGIKGNFYLSETEYIAPASFHEKGRPASWIIYSNVKEIVENQRQFVFDSFWSRGIPAEQKIKEIEEGVIHYETKVIENKHEIFNHIKSVLDKANERSVVSSIGGMQLVYNNFFEEYKKIIDKQRRTGGVGEVGTRRRDGDKGIRWITSVDKHSVELVKIFINAGIQVRHVKNLAPMNFAVDERYFYATIDKMENGALMTKLLTSNEPAYISHYNSVFEELWKNGVDAIQRIKDIEGGINLADIEVIPGSERAQEIYLDMVKGASDEILWIFPTSSAFIRQEKIGAIQLAKQAAKERNVKVRIMIPANNLIEQKIQQLKRHCASDNNKIIDIRYIAQMSETKATILVIDRKASLVMEVKDDSKTTFTEAIGLSTYSNSKAGVSSYVAIFENLWRQAELYDQLKEAHEQLKTHDKMQREFINIAAHELRTPIQPILGLTQVLSSKLAYGKGAGREEAELLNVITRNAKRLHQLTENILDVTKIESNSLQLNKERFNLRELILNSMSDFKGQLKENDDARIELLSKEHIFIQADKTRIGQVISNLLNNAIKFNQMENSKESRSISVTLDENKHDNNNEVIVRIKDTGTGIAPEIMPRLFTKFVTKSFSGTGLGLFISKSIIEAHGGRIWAENNSDDKGATFAFALPVVNKWI